MIRLPLPIACRKSLYKLGMFMLLHLYEMTWICHIMNIGSTVEQLIKTVLVFPTSEYATVITVWMQW